MAGFCYVGDIPLAISVIRGPSATRTTRINRVLYIDLDLHHGDGPASSYSSTKNVLTLSIHLHAPLFYPATGALDSTGPAKSQSAYHDLNLACEPGLSTPSLLRLFNSCVLPVMTTYQPQAIVVQCGCDGLAGDPCAEWNLSLEGMGECVSWILQHADAHKAKVLLLGGGGYSNVSAARCYAYLTSIAVRRRAPLGPSVELTRRRSGHPCRSIHQSLRQLTTRTMRRTSRSTSRLGIVPTRTTRRPSFASRRRSSAMCRSCGKSILGWRVEQGVGATKVRESFSK